MSKNDKRKPIKEKILIESGELPIYREYEYPDGQILRLTKQEFEQIAEAFFLLAK